MLRKLILYMISRLGTTEFWEKFSWQFYLLSEFLPEICCNWWRALTWNLDCGLTNRPIHYLLDYGRCQLDLNNFKNINFRISYQSRFLILHFPLPNNTILWLNMPTNALKTNILKRVASKHKNLLKTHLKLNFNTLCRQL